MSNWDALSEEEKKDLSSMNHLFRNRHAVIGFADYSDSALKSLEGQWRRDHGQLGTETLREFQNKNGEYSWSHSDSAVQRSPVSSVQGKDKCRKELTIRLSE